MGCPTLSRELEMTFDYLARRLGMFVAVIFVATSLNFFLPRFTGQDPIATKLEILATEGVATRVEDYEKLVATYNEKFGLNRPVLVQYLNYLSQIASLDLGFSITLYPTRVAELIRSAMPWSIGLLVTSTLLAFTFGTLGGALLAWQYGPRAAFEIIFPPFFLMAAVPYYLLGLLLVFVFAFELKLLPLQGGFSSTVLPDWSDLTFWGDVIRHSMLPALSIILASVGFWALGMRSMMITMQGEDYMLQAEAKGLRRVRIFFRYAVRNAVLPQTTALALTLPHVVSGAILVERIFSYPGVGLVLYDAISGFDYFVIQGLVFIIVVAIAIAMLIIDLVYPLLDPRINYNPA